MGKDGESCRGEGGGRMKQPVTSLQLLYTGWNGAQCSSVDSRKSQQDTRRDRLNKEPKEKCLLESSWFPDLALSHFTLPCSLC